MTSNKKSKSKKKSTSAESSSQIGVAEADGLFGAIAPAQSWEEAVEATCAFFKLPSVSLQVFLLYSYSWRLTSDLNTTSGLKKVHSNFEVAYLSSRVLRIRTLIGCVYE